MSNRRLILGSEGFVGGYLRESLKDEDDVFFSDYIQKADERYYQCDVTDPADTTALIKETSPDSIVYLTSQSSVKRSFAFPQETFKVNVEGLLNVLEAIKNCGKKPYFIFVSSIEVYKNGNTKINERSLYQCNNPYAISKSAGEDLISLYKRLGVIDGIIVQPVAHIGPGQSDQFSISSFSKQIAQIEKSGGGELFVGNLDVTRDILDVRDVVEFYDLLLKHRPTDYEKVIISSGIGYKYNDIVRKLIELSKNPSIEIKVDEARLRPIDIPSIIASPSYALSKFRWKNRIDMDQTLTDMLDFWRSLI